MGRKGSMKVWFLLALLGVGIPFWLIPYVDVMVPNSFFGPGLVLVWALAFYLRASGRAGFVYALNLMAMPIPAALMLRVVVEVLVEPARHNLWPLVLALCLVMGYAVSLTAVIAGHLVRRMGGRRD